MDIRIGSRWVSTACDTEVVVTKAPSREVALHCGGAPVAPAAQRPADRAELNTALSAGTLLGKRYGSDEWGLEVLCTKAGTGTLSIDGVPLTERQLKSLPSSD